MANYLNFCGFETGDFSETYDRSNTAVLSTSITNGSNYAFKCNPDTGSRYVQFGKINDTGLQGNANDSIIYARFYFLVVTEPVASEEIFVATTANAAFYKLSLRLTPSRTIAVYGSGGTTLLATGTTVLSANQWYCIEVKVGTSADPFAPWTVKINGNIEATGVAGLHANVNGMFFLGKATNRNNASYECYFDDFAVRSDDWCGMGRVKIAVPDEIGVEDFWVPSTGQAFSCVDEVPTNSDTDYISSSIPDDVTTVGMSNIDLTGIINCVKPMIYVRAMLQGSVQLRLRSGSTASDTVDISMGNVYKTFSRLYTTNPDDSSAWTQSTVDDVEVGIVFRASSGSTSIRCSTMYLMVDYMAPVDYVIEPTGGKAISGIVQSSPGYLPEPVGQLTFSGVATCSFGFACEPVGSLTFTGESQREYVYCAYGKLTFSGVTDSVLVNSTWSFDASGYLAFSGFGISDEIRYLLQVGGADKYQAIVLSDGGTYNGSNAIVGFGYISYNSDGSTQVDASGGEPVLEQWYHLAFTRDSSNIFFYINGLADHSGSVIGTTEYGTSPEVVIGDGLFDQGFDGAIDEIRIYSRALTSDQVATLAAGEDFSTASFSYDPNYIFNARGRLKWMGDPAAEHYSVTAEGGLTLRGIVGNAVMPYEPIFAIGDDAEQQALVVSNGFNGITGFGFISSNADTSTYYGSDGVIPTVGQWYHLAMVREQSVIKLYVNGTLAASVPTSVVATFGVSPKALLGKLLSYRLGGTIDDARFYLRPLTQEDVTNLANGNDLSTASFFSTAVFSYEASGSLLYTSETSGDFVYNPLGKLRISGRASLARGGLNYEYDASGALIIKGVARVVSVADNVDIVAGTLRLSGITQVQRTTMRYNASGALRLTEVNHPRADFTYDLVNGKIRISGHASFFKLSLVQPVGKFRITGIAEVGFLPTYEASGKLGTSRLQPLRKLTGTASAQAAPNFVGFGQLRLKGTASVEFIDFTAIGGALQLRGTATTKVRYGTVDMTGALILSGAATTSFTTNVTYNYVSSGKLILSGASALVLLGAEATGALRFTGIADVQSEIAYASSGALILSGIAKAVAGSVFEPQGALVLSGAISTAATFAYAASGALRISGTTVIDATTTTVNAGGKLLFTGVASLTGTAHFPNFLASGLIRLSGINKHATAFTYNDANGALFLKFLTGIAGVEWSIPTFSNTEVGILPMGLRSCSPGITQHTFFLMLNDTQSIKRDLEALGFDGWEFICWHKPTREGTIRIDKRYYVVKVPESNATNKIPVDLPTVEDKSTDINRSAMEPKVPQTTVDLLTQSAVLVLMQDGSFKTYLQGLSLDQWKVVAWNRATRVVELQLPDRRRVSITLTNANTASTPVTNQPTNVPIVPLSMTAEWQEPEKVRPIQRRFGNGVAVGISQDKFINLVKNKELKKLLSGLSEDDWQIRSFDRKTKKAELRVQNRYITVGV